jgi:hypothetical protein
MKIKFGSISYIEIVGDGAIATSSVGVGRFISCLILDTDDRDDVSKVIMASNTKETMDSEIQWCRPFFRRDILYLRVKYQEPFEVDFYIRFDILKHAFLIETIMNNKAVILYKGKKGDKISKKIKTKADSVLIEVPDTGYKKTWRKMLDKTLRKKFENDGISRGKAKEMAVAAIQEIENFKNIKMK